MKGPLKIILIVFAAVIVGFGLLIGGMYLFGGFDEKPVYASSIYFREGTIKTSTSFSMDLLTNDSGVNRTQVTLTTDGGDGDRIIDYPETVNIGSSFWITPKRDASGKNIGGTVVLRARYTDSNANSVATATCRILVDVPVEEVSLKHIGAQNYGGSFAIAHSGDRLDTLLENITPSVSLSPYVSPNRLNTAQITVQDKAVYLAITTDGRVNTDKVYFDLGSLQKSHLLKVGYHYDSQNGFVLDSDISIVAMEANMNVEVTCFVVPTYQVQEASWKDNISLSDLKNMNLVTSTSKFFVKDYSIDNMTINNDIVTESKSVYINEKIKFYINNPNIEEGSNDINLGIQLVNNNSITPSDLLLSDVKAYVYVGDDVRELSLQNLSQPSKTAWCFEYEFDSFLVYYNYQTTSTVNDNKIRVEVVYADSEKEENEYIRKSFYLNPAIHNASGLFVNYEEGADGVFVVENEGTFTLNNRVSINSDSEILSGARVAYYIADSSQNELVTMPTQEGNYKLEFDITLSRDAEVQMINIVNGWSTFENCTVTFTQGTVSYTINYTSGKPAVTTDHVSFVADAPIHVEVSKLAINSTVTDEFVAYSNNLFSVTTTNSTLYVSNKDVKFYSVTTVGGEDVVSALPYIKIGGVVYSVDFDFYKDSSGNRYVYVDNFSQKSIFKVSGIGSFGVTAQLVYEENGIVYWLGVSAVFEVSVTENLTSITIYKGEINVPFGATDLVFDESAELGSRKGKLFITSSELQALKTFVEQGKVHLQAYQSFDGKISVKVEKKNDEYQILKYDSLIEYIKASDEIKASYGVTELSDEQAKEVRTKLANVNKNAITFAQNWIPVTDDENNLVGYSIEYTVGEVETIYLDSYPLANKFSIIVYAQSSSIAEPIVASFTMSGSGSTSSQEEIVFEVQDKTLAYSKIVYGTGQTSLNITASALNNAFAWRIDSISDIKPYFDMAFGFNYTEGGSDYIKTGLKWSLKQQVGTSFVDLSADLWSLEGSRLTIKNLPKKEGDIILRFSIYSDTISASNCHKAWNAVSRDFVSVINDGIRQGASFTFNVSTVEIQIAPNASAEVHGIKNDSTLLLSNNSDKGLFQVAITGLTGDGIDYSTFFKTEILKEGAWEDVDIILEAKDNNVKNLNLVFQKDFLADGNVKLRFSYFDGTPLYIFGTSQNVYTLTIGSRYFINFSNELKAPVFTAQEFCSIYYYESNDSEPIQKNEIVYSATGEIDLTQVNLDDIIFITISNINSDPRFEINDEGRILLKAVSEEYHPVIEVVLRQVVDGVVRSNTQTITIDVSPKYSQNELLFVNNTYRDDGQGGQVEIPYLIAGEENAISFEKTGAINEPGLQLVDSSSLDSDKEYISRVDISFVNYSDDNNTGDTLLVASDHMAQTADKTIAKTGLYSYDLTYNKDIVVTFVFSFESGGVSFGSYTIVKKVAVLKNIEVDWDTHLSGELSSGANLVLGYGGTYGVIRYAAGYDDNKYPFAATSFAQDYATNSTYYSYSAINNDLFEYGNDDRIYFYGKTGEKDQTGADIYKYSFDFADYEEYFYVSTLETGNPFLSLGLKSGATEDVDITIVFYYAVVDGFVPKYEIPVELALTLHISPSA